MNRINICKNIIQSIRDYITNPDNLDAYREKNRFVRKRKLSIFHVIMYLLFTSKASMYQNLFRIRTELKKLEFPDVSKQALSKARQSIHPDLFLSLFNISVDSFYSQLPQRRTWNGYHLLAVDGSKLELPNSKSNFEFFGEMFTYPNPERRFTSGLASIIYDVLDDYIVHASLNPYLTSERTVAKEHIANLEALEIFTDNSIVIFDRGYYSEGMFRFFSERNHLCLMRLKSNVKIVKNCKGDTMSTLPGNPKLGTDDIKIRVVKVDLPNGTKEYLATTIFFLPGPGPSRRTCPSGNAGDHHSILSISIFTCRLFPSLSICRLKTGEAPARGSAHQKFDAPPTSGASLPVYTKSLNSSVLYTPFSSIFLKLSFTAATSS